MSGLAQGLKAGKPPEPVPAPAAPSEARAPHWREIWDDFWHGVVRLGYFVLLGVPVAFGGACVGLVAYYYQSASRLGAATDVLMWLDLEEPESGIEFAAQNAVLTAAERPAVPFEFLCVSHAAAALFVYAVAVMATRDWRHKRGG